MIPGTSSTTSLSPVTGALNSLNETKDVSTNQQRSLNRNQSSDVNDTNSGVFSSRFSKFDKVAVSIIILLSIFKGLTWSLFVPPFYGFDEPLHFIYGRKIQQTHTARFGVSTMIPLDIWELDTPPEQRRKLPPGVSPSTVWIQDEEQGVATQPGFCTYHPPFYYGILAAILFALSQKYVLWQIFACRMLSIGLGLTTTVCAYMTGKFFWREPNSIAPLTLATLVTLHPMSAFSFGIVSNSAMEIALYSLLTVALLKTVEQKITARTTAVISLLMFAGLMNKLSFATAVPLVVLAGLWQFVNRRRFNSSLKTICAQLAAMLLPAIACVSLWFSKAWQTGGENLIRVFDEKGRRTPFTVFDYLWHYQWFDRYSKTAASYFGHFGWKDASIPVVMIVVLLLLFVSAAVYSIVRATRELRMKNDFSTKARSFAALVLFSGTAALILFYASLDMRMNAVLGGWFTIRGQYYLSAIIGQLLAVVLLFNWKKRNLVSDLVMLAAIAGSIWLNYYCLFSVVAQYNYGTLVLTEVLQAAASLQPVNATFISTCLNLFGITCGATVLLAVANLITSRRAKGAQ